MITRALDRASRHPVLMGVVAAVLFVALIAFVIRPMIYGVRGDGTEIEAEFASTSEVRLRDPVRVGGVDVGEITRVELDAERRLSRVTMRVDEDIAIKGDARASLRWRTLLGGSYYVDLDPGSRSAPRVDQPRIPLARTTSQVEFDHLTQVFDGDTGPRLRGLLRGLHQSFAAPEDTGRALEALAPAMRSLARGLPPLRGNPRRRDLRRLVATTGRTLAGLGRDTGALERLVTDAATTLRATASQRASLGRLIDLAPGALDATRVTAHRIDRTLARLDPVVDDLRPGARALDPALRVTRPLLDDATRTLRAAQPLLGELDPALRALQGASRAGTSLIGGLKPAVGRLDDTVLPYFAKPDAVTGRSTAEMIGPTFAIAGNAASEFDGEGYWLRFSPSVAERVVLVSPCLSQLLDPTKQEKLRCDALAQTLHKLLSPQTSRRQP